MKLRAAAALIAAAGIALTACGSQPDPAAEATTRACHLLATAEDQLADATNAYVAMGKPSGGSQAVRDATNNYPVLISQAANEALSAPSDISASFQDAAKNAVLYKQAAFAGDYKSGGVFAWAISGTVKKCKDAGVDMPISEIITAG